MENFLVIGATTALGALGATGQMTRTAEKVLPPQPHSLCNHGGRSNLAPAKWSLQTGVRLCAAVIFTLFVQQSDRVCMHPQHPSTEFPAAGSACPNEGLGASTAHASHAWWACAVQDCTNISMCR
jgi:hypothetical protein